MHGPEALCEAGLDLYTRALREGRIHRADAEGATCLVDLGLLHPAVDDLAWLEPVAPVVALHRHLRTSEDLIARERRREAQLVDAFEPLLRLGADRTTAPDTTAISLISGRPAINLAITQSMAEASTELLAIHPHTSHVGKPPGIHAEALARDQSMLDRGGRIRTLYQHTLRHAPTVLARYERLEGDVQARTLDEVTERLLVIDRTVAFVPATADRTLALEIRQPALVNFLATTFDRLWRLATPMYPQAVQQPTLNGITPASAPSPPSSSRATRTTSSPTASA